MTLQQWFSTHGIKWTDGDMARQLHVSRYTVLRWRNGERRPTLEVMFEIERLTKGMVKIADWLKTKPRPRPRKVA